MSRYQVLLLEDDPIWQIKIQLMLEEQGDKVHVAGSLAEAAQILGQTYRPDLILADVILPDGISYQFFENTSLDCPIFFITEFAEKKHLDSVLRLPSSTFFVKPLHSLTLEAAIQNVMKLRLESKTPSLEVPVRYAIKKDVALHDIYWIEVKANYVSVKTLDSLYVFKGSFPLLSKDLDDRFVRVSKSMMVNRDCINRVNLKNDTIQILDKSFDIGRTFRRAFLQAIYGS